MSVYSHHGNNLELHCTSSDAVPGKTLSDLSVGRF